MDFVNFPLLGAAALVFTSVLAGLFSVRIGFSFLLVFLLAGILAGEDGLGGYRFDDYKLSFWVGNVALAIILLDGGLRTSFATFRTGLRPASVLASLGVAVCASITAVAGVVFVGLDWGTAMLLGAIVGSTDAAAVFSLLSRSGVVLNERVAATLEIESGVNDPMAVYLTLTLIALLASNTWSGSDFADSARLFVQQFGWGSLMGLTSGFGMAALLSAGGLSVFAATGLLDGSGFLAIYLYGLILANRASKAVQPTLGAMDGYAWLAQAGMFLLLGLLVTPSTMAGSLGSGLAVALTLIFVARPVAVWLCLLPFHFSARETWFISWVGLRGAVPVVLAIFPLMAGTAEATLLFNIAFMVVLVSLLTQGTTIALVARRLGVALPDPADEAHMRAVFRDFSLNPRTPVGDICSFYNLPVPAQTHIPLGDWMAAELHRPPVVGDVVSYGNATFVVRELKGDSIAQVGLGLPA